MFISMAMLIEKNEKKNSKQKIIKEFGIVILYIPVFELQHLLLM